MSAPKLEESEEDIKTRQFQEDWRTINSDFFQIANEACLKFMDGMQEIVNQAEKFESAVKLGKEYDSLVASITKNFDAGLSKRDITVYELRSKIFPQ